jgi:hypothetical protein
MLLPATQFRSEGYHTSLRQGIPAQNSEQLRQALIAEGQGKHAADVARFHDLGAFSPIVKLMNGSNAFLTRKWSVAHRPA